MNGSSKIRRAVTAVYNDIAAEFQQTRKENWEECVDLAKKVPKTSKVLDIGCGAGRMAALFPPENYTGIDISKNMIHLAKGMYPGRIFMVGDAVDGLPFADASFDAVFLIAMFHHLPTDEDREKVLAECHRVLKKKGMLFVTVWNLRHIKKYEKERKRAKMMAALPFSKRSPHDLYIKWKTPKKKRYYYAFAKDELKKIVEDAQFTVTEDYYVHRGQQETASKGSNIVICAQKQ